LYRPSTKFPSGDPIPLVKEEVIEKSRRDKDTNIKKKDRRHYPPLPLASKIGNWLKKCWQLLFSLFPIYISGYKQCSTMLKVDQCVPFPLKPIHLSMYSFKKIVFNFVNSIFPYFSN
jgi:hypothetical protein